MNTENRWKGLVLGAVGGAVGTLAMGYYFKALAALPSCNGTGDSSEHADFPLHGLDDISLVGRHYHEGEGSTAALGRIAYQTLAHRPPESQEIKTVLSQLVHWNFGMGMGSLYGAIRGRAAVPDTTGGLIFGVSVWLFASELLVPLLGLSPGPTTSPPSQHAKEFGAHIVYGVVTAATTQVLQRMV